MSYLSQPALSKTHLYFITEEDLWSVPLSNPNSQATRLTSGLGPMSHPQVSPDGKWVAVASENEGHTEVYVLPAEGGDLKRLTYYGALAYPVCWRDSATLVLKSNVKSPFRMQEFFQVSIYGGLPFAMNFGEGTNIDFSIHGVVIERNMHRPDPAQWKRYRGGTMGQLWVAKSENDSFQKLRNLPGNLSTPHFVGERIFYLSDETGLGRLYSCDLQGENKRIQGGDFYSDYYFRNLSTNGQQCAFQSAGDLYLYDVKTDQIQKLDIRAATDSAKAQRKSVATAPIFKDYSLQPQGEKLLLEARGKVLCFAHWSGPVTTIGQAQNFRYKCADWLADGKRMVVVADDGLKEHIEIYSDRGELLKTIPPSEDLVDGYGRVLETRISPRADEVLISNHRNELIFLDLTTSQSKLIHKDDFRWMDDMVWSPDGRYVSFARTHSRSASQIVIWEKSTGNIFPVSEGVFQDYSPHFDPEGKYLYFLSKRIYNPIYDDAIFDMTFPKAGIPLLVVLKKGEPSPLLKESTLPDSLTPKPFVAKVYAEVACEIDFDGLSDRIIQFPVLEAKYTKIVGLGRKVLWSYLPVEGTVGLPMGPSTVGKEYLDCFDFMTGKFEYFGTGVTSFKVRHECNLRVVRYGNILRILKATDKPEDLHGKEDATPKSGVINLARANIMVNPREEWVQMFNDAWRMQKEFFWREDMGGMDWDAVYSRYLPVLQKISSRREFTDLLWEVIGELGTSHAYAQGGDLKPSPSYPVGGLGADFMWNETEKAYEVMKVYHGDVWATDAASPLLTPGVAAKAGDFILEISGQKLSETLTPQEASLNLAGREVFIRYRSKGDSTVKEGMIRLLKDSNALLYRTWVEEKRLLVKVLSKGRLGYVHIPNMVGQGFAEFHRNFMQEVECEGLIIDVRYNGGGHVSQLILDRLARKPIGKSVSRWMGTRSVPYETVRKVAVAVCNEFAGSDGDIFSHTFKMRKIGKLIGTRTWGGVVGIWPRQFMSDGGWTTQPEFSTWFEDVEYGLENHGAEPDQVVEFPPEAWRKGEDPQLTAAVAEAMKSLS